MIAQFDGFGIGLRKPHYSRFVDGSAKVDFVEAISENFMVEGGRPLHVLRTIRGHYPVALHGVSMSLGSAEGLDQTYLSRLKALVDDIEPIFVSDHLSWSRVGGFHLHDLLPLPLNEEALGIVCANIAIAQDALGREILVENPSTYIAFPSSTMSETDFLNEICVRTGCGLLLDINNLFVTCSNLAFDPFTFLDDLRLDCVRQIHLAGHSKGKELLIDTHDEDVSRDVWFLYALVAGRLGRVATMIERDDAIPELDELLDELSTARALAATAAFAPQ